MTKSADGTWSVTTPPAVPGFHYYGIQDAAQALQAAGIRIVYSESPGTGHEWQTWRGALYDFAPRLFTAAGGE